MSPSAFYLLMLFLDGDAAIGAAMAGYVMCLGVYWIRWAALRRLRTRVRFYFILLSTLALFIGGFTVEAPEETEGYWDAGPEIPWWQSTLPGLLGLGLNAYAVLRWGPHKFEPPQAKRS